MSRFGDGLATGPDLLAAADAAAAEALAPLVGRLPDLVCAFVSGGSPDDAAAALEPFAEVWNLVKPTDGSSGWLLAGIQQMH